MQDIKDVVEEWDRAFEKKDVQAALELFADDAKWTVPAGTFSGKDSIRRAVEWEMRLSRTTFRLTGIGVLAAGNVAVREAVGEEVWEGIDFDYPLVTVMEFNDDRKIQRMASYCDHLRIEQQIAAKYPGIKGWVFRKLINFAVAQAEKGRPDPGSPGGLPPGSPS